MDFPDLLGAEQCLGGVGREVPIGRGVTISPPLVGLGVGLGMGLGAGSGEVLSKRAAEVQMNRFV